MAANHSLSVPVQSLVPSFGNTSAPPVLLNSLIAALVALIFLGCSSGTVKHPPDTPARPTPAGERPSLGVREDVLPGARFVQDGPFVFYLAIYQDPVLGAGLGGGASEMSDTRGFGIFASWRYNGPEITLPDGELVARELYGDPTDLRGRASYRSLASGEQGGRRGAGIRLPDGAAIGDDVTLATRVDTPDGSYGASLTFTLVETDVGLGPSDVRVQVLD